MSDVSHYSGFARRYALALYELAVDSNIIEKVSEELKILKKIRVNEIGNPTKIAKSITPTRIKPRTAGSINSAIIYSLLAIHLFLLPNNFLIILKYLGLEEI